MTSNGPEATFTGTTLCAGVGFGMLLALGEPLSFWGGTDRNTGEIIDTHHPQRGTLLGGRVLLMGASRGSSSSSSVLAEQLRAGVGPSAIVLTSRDAIVCLGVLAAAELYATQTPVVLLTRADADALGRCTGQARVSVRAEPGGSAAVVLSAEPPNVPEPQPQDNT